MGVMRCHYETLGVEHDADETALKKAYRKLALRWHPDKNRDNVVEAEKEFKLIVAAYETLNDPQERAWYDDHRDAILAGGDGLAGDGADGGGKPGWLPNPFRWFSAANYDSFEDSDERGFYRVYGGAFDEIFRAEVDKGVGGAAATAAPPFCGAEADAKSVNSFYAFWSGFSTKLAFGWADLYNPNEVATNRYQRRVVDKENSKARSAAKKEYNEQVRSLVAWVRKRDKRVMKFALEKEALAAAKEKDRLDKVDADKLRRKEAREAWFKVQEEEEERIRAHEEATGERVFRLADEGRQSKKKKKSSRAAAGAQGSSSEQEEEEEQPDVWVCEACSKSFKSEKQFHNHEKSKKHVLQVKKIKKELEIEEREIQRLMREEQEQQAAGAASELQAESDEGSIDADLAKAVAKASVRDDHVDDDDDDDDQVGDDQGSVSSSSDDGEGFTGFGGLQAATSESDEADSDEADSDSDDRAQAAPKQGQDDSDSDGDDKDVPGGMSGAAGGDEDGVAQESSADHSAASATATATATATAAAPPAPPKLGKAKARRRAKEARGKGGAPAGSVPKVQPVDGVSDHLCGRCEQYFETRNQLFKHFTETGHALAPDQVPKALKAASKKKKKKKTKG